MYENTCYENPFLKETILRIDFPTNIPEIEKAVPTKVSNAVIKRFPILEPQQVHGHQVEFTPAGTKTKSVESTAWNFFGVERDKNLTISQNSFVLQVRNYKTYEQVIDDISEPLRLLCETFPDLRANRVGLRYVNVLDFGDEAPLDWSKYIDEKLLAFINFHKSVNLSRAFQILEYNFDGDALKCQLGIANPDYPAKIKRRQFVIDLDGTALGGFDNQEIIVKVNSAHDRVQEFFESCITEETRAKMKVRNDGE